MNSGGSNGSRVRLWKYELSKLAQEIGLDIHVMHYPPGTSKWNKIEHRMFSFISMNWRGIPLVSHEIMVNLISNTTTGTGLKIEADIDTNKYPTGRKITKKEMSALPLIVDKFLPERNYTLLSQPPPT